MFATEYPYSYYGVSISGWKNLLASYEYHFVTEETNGVNAFFINPIEFVEAFIKILKE
jgi:F0F1-type ATP synthase membrane subunit a